MLLVNLSGGVIRTDEFGGLEIPPEGTYELADGYCDARLAMNGSRIPSTAERLLAGMVPVNSDLRAQWGKHLRVSQPQLLTDAQEAARLVEEHDLPPAAAAGIMSGNIEPPPSRRRKRGEE